MHCTVAFPINTVNSITITSITEHIATCIIGRAHSKCINDIIDNGESSIMTPSDILKILKQEDLIDIFDTVICRWEQLFAENAKTNMSEKISEFASIMYGNKDGWGKDTGCKEENHLKGPYWHPNKPEYAYYCTDCILLQKQKPGCVSCILSYLPYEDLMQVRQIGGVCTRLASAFLDQRYSEEFWSSLWIEGINTIEERVNKQYTHKQKHTHMHEQHTGTAKILLLSEDAKVLINSVCCYIVDFLKYELEALYEKCNLERSRYSTYETWADIPAYGTTISCKTYQDRHMNSVCNRWADIPASEFSAFEIIDLIKVNGILDPYLQIDVLNGIQQDLDAYNKSDKMKQLQMNHRLFTPALHLLLMFTTENPHMTELHLGKTRVFQTWRNAMMSKDGTSVYVDPSEII